MTYQQFIYVMKGLRKIVPPKREILKGIWLSFFHGAKIGVVGANGSGKSTLLKIMAGLDEDFLGEAWATKGTTIGYLPQKPELDPELDVRGKTRAFGCLSFTGRRLAWSERTDRARAPCSRSWLAWTKTSSPGQPKEQRSATCRRNPSSTPNRRRSRSRDTESPQGLRGDQHKILRTHDG